MTEEKRTKMMLDALLYLIRNIQNLSDELSATRQMYVAISKIADQMEAENNGREINDEGEIQQ